MVSETPAARASSHLYMALYCLLSDESFIIVLVGVVVDTALCFDDLVVLEKCVFA